MECMFAEKNDKLKDGAVSKVLSRGYLMNGKVLRTVKVSVNSLGEKKETQNAEKVDEKVVQEEKKTGAETKPATEEKKPVQEEKKRFWQSK